MRQEPNQGNDQGKQMLHAETAAAKWNCRVHVKWKDRVAMHLERHISFLLIFRKGVSAMKKEPLDMPELMHQIGKLADTEDG